MTKTNDKFDNETLYVLYRNQGNAQPEIHVFADDLTAFKNHLEDKPDQFPNNIIPKAQLHSKDEPEKEGNFYIRACSREYAEIYNAARSLRFNTLDGVLVTDQQYSKAVGNEYTAAESTGGVKGETLKKLENDSFDRSTKTVVKRFLEGEKSERLWASQTLDADGRIAAARTLTRTATFEEATKELPEIQQSAIRTMVLMQARWRNHTAQNSL